MNNFSNNLKSILKKGSSTFVYKNYQHAKKKVLEMLDNLPPSEKPSSYWQEELAGSYYIFDASPLIINSIRKHSYHLTGLMDYQYRKHHIHNAKSLENKLALLKLKDKSNLLVPESRQLGGFGFEINNNLYNLDTLKFYECLITLDQANILKSFKRNSSSKKKVVLEIGSGWGGFAYQFKTLFPKTTYILVDLPASFIFSSTYLLTMFKTNKFLFVTDKDQLINLDVTKYDFIFIPHYLWLELSFQTPDLVINMVSFQEMTTQQVEDYIKKSAEWGVKHLYSLNRDRSPNNPELSTVSSILEKYYKVKNIDLLPMSYLYLVPNTKKTFIQKAKDIVLTFYKPSSNKIYDYHHLLGEKI